MSDPTRAEEQAAPRAHRPVSSFVRRSSRMRPNQRAALDQHGDAYVVPVARGELDTSVAPGPPLDVSTLFGRTAPLVVEIGPGTGESLLPMAADRPDVDILAVEVYEPAVARLVAALAAAEVRNVRIVRADATGVLRHLLEPAGVAELWTFFPDPWPKARHHKRRLVDGAFADLAAARVAPGGCWRLATDWPAYAEQMREVLDAHPAWRATEDRADRPVTRFEARGLAAGRPVTDLAYARVEP